ncbi:MAG: hypothetical protein KKF56_00630 [Nanoarchaeota archaeon]|nr:hypothetical protein [Nanoarchaeota archaeon]
MKRCLSRIYSIATTGFVNDARGMINTDPNINILITDLAVEASKGDGLELAEYFKRKNPKGKVIVYSAWPLPESGRENVDFTVSKNRPGSPETLLDIIQHVESSLES